MPQTKHPVFTYESSWIPDYRSRFQKIGVPEGAQRPLRLKPHVYREVSVEEGWVEAPLDNAWMAAYRIAVQQGQPVVAELRIFPLAGPRPGPGRWRGERFGPGAKVPYGGLTSRLVRRVRVAEHLRVGVTILAKMKREEDLESVVARFMPATDAGSSKRRAGARPDVVLADFARQYVNACLSGSRRPIAEVADANGTSVATMRNAIERARERGLLTKPMVPAGEPTQGRKGGALTPRAKRLLNQNARPKKGGRR